MAKDRWGLKQVYPTKKTAGLSGTGVGFKYEQSANILDDENHFNGEGDVKGASNFTWTMETSGPTSVQIFKHSDSADSIGGCDMNFSETYKRGYGYRKDEPQNVEVTFLMKFLDSESDNGFAIEGPTGRHSGDGCCQGFAYKVDIQYKENPPKFRFRKEMWHVSNHNDPKTGVWGNSKFNFDLMDHDKWVGFKYIHYVKQNGISQDKDSVVLELWGNVDPEANPESGWFLMKRTEDKGGWGDDGDDCNGDKDQVGAWSNSNIRLKSNDEGGVFQFKWLSMREIDPMASFDSDPAEPIDNPNTSPEEVTGLLTLKYDINVYRIGQCSPAGSVEFYNSPRDPVDNTRSWTFHIESSAGIKRDRIGMVARDLGSVLVNQPPLLEADFWLWKVGSPTGTLTVRIRNKNGTIKATMGTLDVSTLTTSPALKQFINLSNGYKMVVGDYLLAEYTSGDTSNYVRMGKRDTLYVTGGVSTRAVHYNVDVTPNRYEEHSTREIVGVLLN